LARNGPSDAERARDRTITWAQISSESVSIWGDRDIGTDDSSEADNGIGDQ